MKRATKSKLLLALLLILTIGIIHPLSTMKVHAAMDRRVTWVSGSIDYGTIYATIGSVDGPELTEGSYTLTDGLALSGNDIIINDWGKFSVGPMEVRIHIDAQGDYNAVDEGHTITVVGKPMEYTIKEELPYNSEGVVLTVTDGTLEQTTAPAGMKIVNNTLVIDDWSRFPASETAYSLNVTLGAADNYAATTVSGSFKVIKSNQNITITPINGLPYSSSGTAIVATVSGVEEDPTVTITCDPSSDMAAYSYSEGVITVDWTKVTNLSPKLTITFAATTNYNSVILPVSISYAKADQDALTVTDGTIDYNSAAIVTTVSGGSGSGALSLTESGFAVDTDGKVTVSDWSLISKNEYTITVTKAGGTFYNDASASFKVTVNPIDQSAFDADPAMPITVTYGSNTLLTTLKNGQSLTPGNPTPEYVLVSGQEGVSLSADGKLTADWSKLHPGSYTIKVKRNGTIFYNEKVMEISLTVNKADQETIGMTTINLTPTYGDTGPVAQITGGGNSSYYTNVPFSASTGFTVDTSGYVYVDWSIVHASDIPYTASITAPGNNCYNEATVTFNVTVGKRKITVINPDDQTKVYDGTTAVYDMDSKPITTSITGYLSKDLATAGVDTITPATAAYDSVNVDEATTITLTYTEDAMKALIAESMWDNYIFDSSTQTNTASYITSKPVTVAVSAEDKVYDGEDDNVKVTAVIEASQLVPRDQSTIGKQEWTITDGAIDSDGDAGTRTVTAALTLPEALQAHSNYVFDSDQADVTVTDDDVQHAISITGFTMEVTKKPVAVTAVAAMKTYDGKKDNIEVTATIEASELVTKDQTKIGKQEWTVKDGWSETANAGSTTASANLTLPDELQNYMFDTGIADTTWKSDTELEISKVPLTIEKRVLSLQVADATFTGISGFDPAELEWADASEKVIYTGFVDGEDKTSAGITDPEITINTELIKDLNKDKETVIASALGVADSSGDGGTNYVFDYENVVCGDLTVIPIIYQPDEGTNSTWTTASTGPMAFSFSRSENDERAFDHCTEIKMDGQTVDAKDAKGRPNYIIDTEKEILKLQPIYLRTLSAGSHTLTVCFDDGENVEVSFTIEISKFTISFVDENGKVLQSSEVAYGNTPEYTGKTPTKQADEDYSYEFTGWTPEIKEVEGEATYTASFESFAKGVLTFDLGGETFIIKANIGDVIIVPPAPLREGYEFQYWEGSKYYPGDKYTVTGDHTLKAVYEKIEPKEENKPTEESEAGATTGDNAPVGFWVSLMLVSLLGILILQRVRSKRCS